MIELGISNTNILHPLERNRTGKPSASRPRGKEFAPLFIKEIFNIKLFALAGSNLTRDIHEVIVPDFFKDNVN